MIRCRRNWYSLLLLFWGAASLQGGGQGTGGGIPDASLERALTKFWEALAAGRIDAAVEFVAEESAALLEGQYRPAVENWRVLEVGAFAGGSALISVEAECRIPGSPHPLPVRVDQQWRRSGLVWKLHLDPVPADAPSALELLYGRSPPAEPSGRLRMRPEVLTLHFFNAPQRGVLLLSNETETSVRLLRVEVDSSRFRIVSSVEDLEPGREARVIVEYIGPDRGKELESRAVLHFQGGTGPFERKVPILYNHISPHLRAFFALEPEQVDELQPGDPLPPSLP